MDVIVKHGGEILLSVFGGLFIIGIVMLLIGDTNLGVLREYIQNMLEMAC